MHEQKHSSAFKGLCTRVIRLWLVLGFIVPGAAVAPAHAADLDPVLLVASRRQVDPLYRHAVLIAKPIGNRQYIGFILNKPIQFASRNKQRGRGARRLPVRLYFGGPYQLNSLFALVNEPERPGPGALEITDDLFAVMQKDVVRRIVRAGAPDTRFFSGTVLWRPGELGDELKRGLWYTMKPDIDTVMSLSSKALWEKLLSQCEERARFLEHGI